MLRNRLIDLHVRQIVHLSVFGSNSMIIMFPCDRCRHLTGAAILVNDCVFVFFLYCVANYWRPL